MASYNTTIGSVLTIPDGLISDLEKVDEKIKKIQEASEKTANVFNVQFASMSSTTGTLINNLSTIISQLGTISSAAQTASQATQGMGSGMGAASQGATNFGNSITGVIQSINQMIGQLQQTGQIGTSSLMAAKLAADKLMEAMQFKDGKLIPDLKAQIDAINTELKNEEGTLTKVKQEALIAQKRRLQEELKEAERTQNERAVNLQRVLDRMAKAEQSYQRQVAQARKRTAEEYKSQNYASNTTYQGSLNFAENANTINRRTQAIKYLTDARNALSKTDAEYSSKLEKLNAKIKELNAANRQAIASSQELNGSHSKLMDTAGQLQRAFALMFSVSQIRGYIGQIAQVRGEFELQQRSLEAILQNKTKADAIFNKTVMLAVQSPFQIKDLISYTKQLAAYRIESDKLYDTTKRLADVSAGLGVDMQRLILAYGQVKAAAYLRGTEVRQFTEAGINLYGELQAYFKEVKGEAYTTAQIVDMISKRMVTFEDVEAIFKRITDQGGIFYNMQAIQAETLQGKIANLKDSIDVMLNDIGKNNESIFKGAIDATNTIIRNWEKIANVGKALIGVFMLLKIHSLQTGVAMSSVFTKTMMANAASTLKFTELLHYGFLNLGKSAKIFGANMKAAFMTNLPLIAITALVSAIYEAYSRINSFREAVTKSNEELVKARGDLADLANEYKNLQTAMNDASKVQERKKDPAKDIEARRNALQKLIDLAGKNGLTLKIKVEQVKEEELDAVFNEVKNKYNRFLTDIAILQRKTELNKMGNAWYTLSDNIDEDATDYRNAVIDILAQSDKLDVAIANVKANYDNLSESSKKYFTEISMGKKDRETEIEYYTRMYNAMLQINKLNVGTLGGLPEWLKETNDVLKDVSGGFGDIETQAKEFSRELDDVLGDVIAQMRKRGEEGVVIQAVIDRYAAQQGYDDIQKMFMYNHFNVKVEFDKDDINKSIGSIKQQLDNAFANNVYTISFVVAGVDAKTGYSQLKKEMDSQLSRLQELVEMRRNLKGGNYVGYDPVALNTEINELYKDISNMGKGYRELANRIMGYDKANKASSNSAKAQRDIFTEQIDLLDKITAKYKELRKHKSAAEAVDVLKKYFADNIKYSKLEGNLIENLLGADGEIDVNKIAERIKTIALKFKEQTKKMGGLQKATDLEINATVEIDNDSLDAAKKKVDDAFNSLSVYTDLKKLGLGDADIFSMFGELPKTFDDVQKAIDDSFFGKKGKEDLEAKAELEKKLQEQIVKYNLDTYKEIVKAYGNQLDEQLQLDIKYAEEKKKINDVVTDPEQRKKYQANLDKWYAKESDANSWKEFQNSEFYIKIFENLDTTSSRVLDAMSKRLQDLRGSLKNLSPEQLKQVVSAMEQINTESISRNPFKNLISGIKDYIKFSQQRKRIEEDYIKSLDKEKTLQTKKDNQTTSVKLAKQRYDFAVKLFGLYSPEAAAAERNLGVERAKLDVILAELTAQGQITQEMEDQIRNGEQLKKTLKDQVGGIADQFSQLASGWGEMESMLQSFGVELPEEIGGALNGLSQASGGIKKILDGDIIGGAFSTIAGVGNTIANVFGFGNKDNKLQKQIEEQQKAVERLQRAYEKLEESIANAFTAQDLNANTHEAIENLRQQNADIEKMIALENDKKKSDSDQIQEWYNQIEDNKEQIEELLRQQTEEMGGFGDKANYKSAAQEFADAWVDAFNEASDTLQALEDTFDDYFDNLLKKQIMQSAVGKYINPVLEQIDKIVQEGSLGGTNGLQIVKEEIDGVLETWNNTKGPLNDFLTGLFETWGLSPRSSSTLSQLQQGIQSLSESTGQALESLLNSIRFFVAQQSTDVAAIRQLLSATSNIEVSNSDNSPMLRELQAQTNVLNKIYGKLDSVIKSGGHPKNGAGIKVFQD